MSTSHLIAASCLLLAGALVGCTDSARDIGVSEPPEPSSPTAESSAFQLASPAFADGAAIPTEHATTGAGGHNISIPLEWGPAPADTQSFAIEVVDLHPDARRWVHWLAIDLPANTTNLVAGASGTSMPPRTRELSNGFGDLGWGGPQPPKGSGVHDYQVTVYALDTASLAIPDDASFDEFRQAVDGHTLASASLVGTFER